MNFFALDVETANADYSSICQIGIVSFSDDKIDSMWQSLIDPEDYFDELNIEIHGITPEMVEDSPTIVDFYPELKNILENKIIASHMPFDRLALSKAAEKYDLQPINCTWLDTAKVARRAWTQFAYKGYGLANLAEFLNIQFHHHNAQEDARAAGEILIKAIAQTGIDIQKWLVRMDEPIFGIGSLKIKREGNPAGPFYGETIVFTGALKMPRRGAADLAARAGCTVSDNVNKTTTLLVVGDQDIRKLAGQQKSTKHRYAEQLISQGQELHIIGEGDFNKLIKQH